MTEGWIEITATLANGPEQGNGLGLEFMLSASDASDDDAAATKAVSHCRIASIKEHSPAEKDGTLEPGDLIKSINGKDTHASTLAQLAAILEALPAEEKVELVVARRNSHEAGSNDGSGTQQKGDGDDPESQRSTSPEPTLYPKRRESKRGSTMFSVHDTVRLMFRFKATADDELDLESGDIVDVSARGEDGWCYGRCLRSSESGFFPANFSLKVRRQQRADALYEDIDKYNPANNNNTSNGSPNAPTLPSKEPNRDGSADGEANPYGDPAYTSPTKDMGEYGSVNQNGPYYASLPARNKSEALYEELPDERPKAEEVIYDETVKREVVSRTESHYQLANGTIYSVVQKPGTSSSKTQNPEVETLTTGQSTNEPVYYSVVDSRFSYVPDDSTGDAMYASLDDFSKDSPVPPAIPDRKYNVENLPPMISVKQEGESMYESLDRIDEENKDLVESTEAPPPPPAKASTNANAAPPPPTSPPPAEFKTDSLASSQQQEGSSPPKRKSIDKVQQQQQEATRKKSGFFGFFRRKTTEKGPKKEKKLTKKKSKKKVDEASEAADAAKTDSAIATDAQATTTTSTSAKAKNNSEDVDKADSADKNDPSTKPESKDE